MRYFIFFKETINATLLQLSFFFDIFDKKLNTMKKYMFLLSLLGLGFSFTSCDDDDPIIPVEQELITTLTYTLSPMAGGADVILRFVDLDGDGGMDPTITNAALAANQTYTGSIELLNEAADPTEDITEEIQELDQEHQFFFSSTISDLAVSYNDEDADGNPLGLSTTVTTGSSASGAMTVILRHEPNKSASGVSNGDITNAGGESDIEVTFQIDVQ